MAEESVESIADSLTAVMNEATSDPESDAATREAKAEAVETEDVETEDVEASEEDADLAEAIDAEEDSEESEEPETVFQAPEHWSSDEREKFDALPPEAQKILLERDKAFQQGYQEKAQGIAAITEAIEPWKDHLARLGVTPEQAIRELFAARSHLDSDPLNGILQIAQAYGVTDQLKSRFAPETDDNDFIDPEVKALKQEISALKSQIEQTQSGFNQQAYSQAQQQIDSFKSATDESGELKHPYFDQVRTRMQPLVQDGKSLEEAYAEVVWTVPEFREAQLKAAKQKETEASDLKKAERVKKAKRAARGVRTNGKADPKEGEDALSLHDTLAEAFRQHSA